jgi:hypothetical protein
VVWPEAVARFQHAADREPTRSQAKLPDNKLFTNGSVWLAMALLHDA